MILVDCIFDEGSVLWLLVTSLGIKDIPKQHVMNNPAIPLKNISHRNSPAPLLRIDIRRPECLYRKLLASSAILTLQYNVSIRVYSLLTSDHCNPMRLSLCGTSQESAHKNQDGENEKGNKVE